MWSASPHFFLSTFLLTLFLPSLSLPLPFSLSILYFTEFHLSPSFSSLCEHTLYFPFFQSLFHPHTIFIFILNLCLWIKSACIQPSTRFKPVGLVQTRLTLWSWWLKITNPLHFFYCCEQTLQVSARSCEETAVYITHVQSPACGPISFTHF